MGHEHVIQRPFQIDQLKGMQSVGRRQHFDLLASSELRNQRRSAPAAYGKPKGFASMSTRRILFAALIGAAVSLPAAAEEKKPVSPPPSGPSLSTSKPATTGSATAPVAAKVNLNSATAGQLEKLPKITAAQAKAIMEARGKAKFKDWNDFVGRKVISADAAAAIKDAVTF